jgi:hypothetical protein
LEAELQRRFFGSNTQVLLFDECSPQYKNAYALPSGYILFGYYMMQDLVLTTHSELPIAGVMAHEFGHQLQFRNGWMNPNASTARSTELEADAFSGYYVGKAKNWTGADMRSHFDTLFRIGDFNFNDRNHHGTPLQRLAAGGLGLAVYLAEVQTGRVPSFLDLHQVFTDRIESCIVQRQDPSPCLNLGSAAIQRGRDEPAVSRDLIAHIDNALIAGIAEGTRDIEEIPSALEVSD